MPRITVKFKLDAPTYHLTYGLLEPGQELEIDEADFGDEIFKKQGLSGPLGSLSSLGSQPKQPKQPK